MNDVAAVIELTQEMPHFHFFGCDWAGLQRLGFWEHHQTYWWKCQMSGWLDIASSFVWIAELWCAVFLQLNPPFREIPRNPFQNNVQFGVITIYESGGTTSHITREDKTNENRSDFTVSACCVCILRDSRIHFSHDGSLDVPRRYHHIHIWNLNMKCTVIWYS